MNKPDTFFWRGADASRAGPNKRTVEDMKSEHVYLQPIAVPDDYHCDCQFCRQFLGVLMRNDGTFYRKLDRFFYYSKVEKAHVARTPLQLARWCVQTYTEPGDTVLDPTIGSGTTAVESLNLGRNVTGVELEFFEAVEANLSVNPGIGGATATIAHGDARNIDTLLPDVTVDLIVNNPPYSGDEHQSKFQYCNGVKLNENERKQYDRKDDRHIALLKEGQEYWETMRDIYVKCAARLRVGGHFCVGVKDMLRNKEPLRLHLFFAEILADIGLEFVGTALLPHYQGTMFMHTYVDRYPGVQIPLYQTIIVFRKGE